MYYVNLPGSFRGCSVSHNDDYVNFTPDLACFKPILCPVPRLANSRGGVWGFLIWPPLRYIHPLLSYFKFFLLKAFYSFERIFSHITCIFNFLPCSLISIAIAWFVRKSIEFFTFLSVQIAIFFDAILGMEIKGTISS